MNKHDFPMILRNVVLESVHNSQPSGIYFGTVMSLSPLKISIEQKMTLEKDDVILSRNVTDFQTNITVHWNTENTSGGSGDASFASHNHIIEGKKPITVHNALVVGDKVIIQKVQGGQKFVVLDRIG